MIPQKQLSLADIFEDCKDIYESDKPQFLTLLENHIDLDKIIPTSFYKHYYASTGRNRKYPLNAMLWALIIQRLFSIPTDSLLLIFLHYSRHLMEFYGFTKVPDASKITRFKQDFLTDLQSVFDNLVDITEPICQNIDGNLASMLLFDTSGIEAYPGVERGSQEWDEKQTAKIIPFRSIDIFENAVSAGTGNFLVDGPKETVRIDESILPEDTTFGVRISGDSMEPEFHDGQIAWVLQQESVANGEIGIFALNGEAYIKKLQNDKDGIFLISLNEKYAPIKVGENDRLDIFGKVLGKSDASAITGHCR